MSIDPAAAPTDPVRTLMDAAEVAASILAKIARHNANRPLLQIAKRLERAAVDVEADRGLEFTPAPPTQANIDLMHERDIGGEG